MTVSMLVRKGEIWYTLGKGGVETPPATKTDHGKYIWIEG